MKTAFSLLLSATVLTGCTQTDVARSGRDNRHVAYTSRQDDLKDRRTITGSNIPTPRDHLPVSPVSATTPSQSFSRDRPSLYPTEPVVGASRNPEPGTEPANVGAGPAGSNPVPPGE